MGISSNLIVKTIIGIVGNGEENARKCSEHNLLENILMLGEYSLENMLDLDHYPYIYRLVISPYIGPKATSLQFIVT